MAVAIPDKNVQFDVKNPKATDESLKAAASDAEKSAANTPTSASTTATTNPAAKPADVKPAEAKPAETKPADTKPSVQPSQEASTTQATQQYAVHIGLVSDKKELDGLLARLRAAGVQPQLRTVSVDGVSKTRVRLGLFKTQAEAAAAAAKIKGVAKNPVVIPIQQDQTATKP